MDNPNMLRFASEPVAIQIVEGVSCAEFAFSRLLPEWFSPFPTC